MQRASLFRTYVFLLIALNISLQIVAFCLMKLSWIYAQHSIFKLINYVTVLAFCASFLRAYIWQRLLKVNDLASSYLPNAVVPSLLLLAGVLIFHEKVTSFNMIGSAIILMGLFLLIKSTTKE